MDNISNAGLVFKRSDRDSNAASRGRVMRMRGGAIVRGEMVRIDITSSDALTNDDYETIDLGTETTASSVFATVLKCSALSVSDIVGVALESAADDALVHVEFAEDGLPVRVKALLGATTTIGLPLTIATDARLDPATTTANGRVVGRCLEAGGDGDLVPILFYGNAGLGFQEDAT